MKNRFVIGSLIALICLFSSSGLFGQDVSKAMKPDTAEFNYSYGLQYYLTNGIFFAVKSTKSFPDHTPSEQVFDGNSWDLYLGSAKLGIIVYF